MGIGFIVPTVLGGSVMVLWIGVDDTDSLRGMCTTFLATEIVRELEREYDLIGHPRLVRLNPNIPWKTRGNGAMCLRFGEGRGRATVIGQLDGRPIYSYPSGRGVDDGREVLARAASVLESWAAFDDPTTNPGIVALSRRPSPALYWKAVRDIVRLGEVIAHLHGRGHWRGYKNRRGLIGAAAATAWRPRDRTYELLAYRRRANWGTPRELDPWSVLEMNERFPSTFNNIDRDTHRVAIAPHSPCPVLYGIRGDDPETLPEARTLLKREIPSRWLVVESNQGTDDHILSDDWSLRCHTSAAISASVREHPRTAPGGHVFVLVRGRREIDLAFYEPSKDFRRVARALLPGDRVRAWGSIREDGRSLNVEKLRVDHVVPQRVRVANPVCSVCGKSMKSSGKRKGFRCVRKHTRAPFNAGSWLDVPRSLSSGWYEPPVYARRHLAKPLQRLVGTESRRALASHPHPE